MSDAFSLILDGDLELMGGEDPDGAFWFETLAQGASFGDPAPVEVAIASLLRDGSLVERTSDGNRAVTFQIKVKSTDPAGVAQGRARLDRLLGKRTTLVWRDGDYPATVFDVETSSAVRPGGFDDLEYLRNEETVALRFECLPYARSLEPVVDNADTPPSDGGTLLYNCESTTGWSQWRSPFVGAVGTEYVVDSTIFTEGAGSIRTRPFYYYYEFGYSTAATWGWADRVSGLALDTGTGGYMSISIKGSHADVQITQDALDPSTGFYMTTLENGEQPVNFIKTSRDEQGFVRYVWPVGENLTVTGLRWYLFQNIPYGAAGTPYVYYDDVRLLPSATTDKLIVKQLDVEGSARTTGSLLVASPADEVALGKVLVVTTPTEALPAGYTPDGRRWVTNGDTTVDADAPSGSYFTPTNAYTSGSTYPVFDVPASMFTAGPYMAVLCCEPTTGGAIPMGVQAQLLVDGVEVGVLSTAEIEPTNPALEYGFFVVGTLFLPPTPVLAPNADVRVRFLFKSSAIRLDNLYLIPAWSVGGRPVADFSIIDCGSGTVAVGGPSSHLWIDSPSASQPQGGYWRGPDATKQLAVSAWPDATKPGLHVFEPGGLTAFVVSTEAQGPRVELTYYPAWHGSAAI